MSFKNCVKAATNLIDEDAVAVLELYDSYVESGVESQEAGKRAMADVLASVKQEKKQALKTVAQQHPTKGSLDAKSAAENLWKLAQGSVIPSVINTRRATGITDETITPDRIRELLNTAVEEVKTGESKSDGLPTNEKDAVKLLVKFVKKMEARGSLKKQAEDLPRPVELISPKTGKGKTGIAAQEGKIALVAETAEGVADEILNEVVAPTDQPKLRQLTINAIKDDGAESALVEYLDEVRTDPATSRTFIQAVQAGRYMLSGGADPALDRAEVVNAIVAESADMDTEGLNNIIDMLVGMPLDTRATATSNLLAAMVRDYGVSQENSNNLAKVINDIVGDEGIDRDASIFGTERDEGLELSEADLQREAEEGRQAMDEFNSRTVSAMQSFGLLSNWLSPTEFTKEVVDKRVKAARVLADIMLSTKANDSYVPVGMLMSMVSANLSTSDPIHALFKKVAALGHRHTAVKSELLADANGKYRAFVSNTEGVRREILLDTSQSVKAMSKGMEKNYRGLLQLKTLAHEVVHMATVSRLRVDPALEEDVRKLFDKAVDYQERFGDEAHYGLENIHEFVAEAFSNPRFMQFLASIPSESRLENLWNEFVDLVRKALGIQADRGTVLYDVVALSDRLFMTEQQNDALDIARRKAGSGAYIEVENLLSDLDKNKTRRTDTKLLDELSDKGDSFTAGASNVLIDALGNDGRQKYDNAINTLKGAASHVRKFMMGNMMLDQIATNYNDLFDGLMEKGAKLINTNYIDANNPLHVLTRALQNRQAAAKKFEADNNQLLADIDKLETEKREQMEAMYEIAHDATMDEVHPDEPWTHKNNGPYHKGKPGVRAKEVVHKRIRNEFMKLDKDVQRMYARMRTFFSTTQAIGIGKLRTNLIKKFGMDDISKLGVAAQIMDDMTDEQIEAMDLDDITQAEANELRTALKSLNNRSLPNGPYFPLLRYGDWVAEANKETEHVFKLADYKNKTAMANAIKGMKARKMADSQGSKFTANKVINKAGDVTTTHNEYAFISAESKAEIERMRNELTAEGFDVNQAGVKGTQKYAKLEGISQVMAIAERKLRGTDTDKQNARVALREALITFMPESAHQKRTLRRLNKKGASKDMGRGLANYMKSAAWSLANLDYITDIATATHAMNLASQKARRAGGPRTYKDAEIEDMTHVAHELQRRMDNPNEPGKITEYASKLGFFNYLFSVSYSVVNSTQPALITLPYLSGKYGTGKAAAALTSAYKMVGGKIVKEAWAAKFGWNAFTSKGVDANQIVTDIRTMIRDGEAGEELDRLLKTLQDEDIIGATFTLEIAEAAKGRGRKGKIGNVFQKTMEMGRTMPHIVEIMNRTTTSIATYQLARGKGMSPDAAIEEARLAVRKTQFDYTELNRPYNFVRNDLLRAMTMFKIHPLGVYGLLLGNVKTLMSNKSTREEGRAAGKTLAMLLATHGTFAGLAGSLLLEPVKIAMGLLSTLFDDDDEMKKWLGEPEIAMRKFLYEATGSAAASEALVFGAPRAVGVDMHTRLGLQSLFLMGSNEGDTSFERGMNTVTDSLLGPILGMEGGFTRMAAGIANGQGWARASEYAMPKGIRDLQRAARYSKVGMTDFNGNLIQDSENFSAKDLAVRALGFSPSVEAETQLGRGFKQRRTGRLRRKVTGLTNRWKNADAAERRTLWQGEIREFNASLTPEERRAFGITRGKLQKGLASRKRRERETLKGAHFTKKERGLRKDLDFINL